MTLRLTWLCFVAALWATGCDAAPGTERDELATETAEAEAEVDEPREPTPEPEQAASAPPSPAAPVPAPEAEASAPSPPPSVREHSDRAREVFGPRGARSLEVGPGARPDHEALQLPPAEPAPR